MSPEFDRRKGENNPDKAPKIRMEPIAPGSNYLQANYSGQRGDLSDEKLHLPDELFQKINRVMRAPTYRDAMELNAEVTQQLRDRGINPWHYTGVRRDQVTFIDQPPLSPLPVVYQITVDRSSRDLRIVSYFGVSAVAAMVPNNKLLTVTDITQLTGRNLPGSINSPDFDNHLGFLSLAQCRIERQVFERFNLDFGMGLRSTNSTGCLLSTANTASIGKRDNLPDNPYKTRKAGSWLAGNSVVFFDRNHQHWQVPGLSLLSMFQSPKSTTYNQTVALRGRAAVTLNVDAANKDNGAPYSLRIEANRNGSEIILNNSGPGLAPLNFKRVR